MLLGKDRLTNRFSCTMRRSTQKILKCKRLPTSSLKWCRAHFNLRLWEFRELLLKYTYWCTHGDPNENSYGLFSSHTRRPKTTKQSPIGHASGNRGKDDRSCKPRVGIRVIVGLERCLTWRNEVVESFVGVGVVVRWRLWKNYESEADVFRSFWGEGHWVNFTYSTPDQIYSLRSVILIPLGGNHCMYIQEPKIQRIDKRLQQSSDLGLFFLTCNMQELFEG
jgi:hypothetical protein